MKLKALHDIPPWDWPEGADRFLLGVLQDTKAKNDDRLLAVSLAGEYEVINDDLALALIGIVSNSAEAENLRGEAVMALAMVLENDAVLGSEDDDGEDEYDEDDLLLSRKVFEKITTDLQKLFMDMDTPDEVRRRALGVSVYAPQAWHTEAVKAAYAKDDPDWRLVAVFCMNFIEGFEPQIMEALLSPDPTVHYQAVCAAGEWGIQDAWKHMVALVQNPETNKELLLEAIDAVGVIRPHEALRVLRHLIDSDDEEIGEAVQDVLIDSGAMSELEADSYDEDDWHDADDLEDEDW